MLGIITHDDVIDVIHEEAADDLQRIAAVERSGFLHANGCSYALLKRGMWLLMLFFFALLTAFVLNSYDRQLAQFAWLVSFIPLIISSGGNSGSQSSTLVITALATKDAEFSDWLKILKREFATGLLLGGMLGGFGF